MMRSFIAAMVTLLAAREAWALQPCNALKSLDTTGNPSTTSAPPVVYVTGSSAIKQLIAGLGPAMFLDPTTPTTIVYVDQTSCNGVAAIVAGVALPTTTTASYWDPNSKTLASGTTTDKEEMCTLAGSTIADVGASDVFPQTCGYALQGLPPGMKEFQGPIQSMTFAVPKGSTETVINAQAAYLTFGLGVLPPWTDPTHIFIHASTSGTQLMIGVALGVDASRWVGTNEGSSKRGLHEPHRAGRAERPRQVHRHLELELLDASRRPDARVPASSASRAPTSPDVMPLDKLNTRNGRYALWGPIHLLTLVDGTGLAANTRARNLIAYLIGSQTPPLGVNLLSIEANASGSVSSRAR